MTGGDLVRSHDHYSKDAGPSNRRLEVDQNAIGLMHPLSALVESAKRCVYRRSRRNMEIRAMRRYRVTFFKNLLSSDGHPFKCLQRVIEVRRARSIDRAVQAAERRYERLHRVPNWKLHADIIELEIDDRKLDHEPIHAAPSCIM
jgi:hypothetical protein